MIDRSQNLDLVIDLKCELNETLKEIRYFSERVMGWREAMPDSYDPEQSVIAQAAMHSSVVRFRLLRKALRDALPAYNEHEEFACQVEYNRAVGLYDLVTLPS